MLWVITLSLAVAAWSTSAPLALAMIVMAPSGSCFGCWRVWTYLAVRTAVDTSSHLTRCSAPAGWRMSARSLNIPFARLTQVWEFEVSYSWSLKIIFQKPNQEILKYLTRALTAVLIPLDGFPATCPSWNLRPALSECARRENQLSGTENMFLRG